MKTIHPIEPAELVRTLHALGLQKEATALTRERLAFVREIVRLGRENARAAAALESLPIRHRKAGKDRDQPCWCGAVQEENHHDYCLKMRDWKKHRADSEECPE